MTWQQVNYTTVQIMAFLQALGFLPVKVRESPTLQGQWLHRPEHRINSYQLLATDITFILLFVSKSLSWPQNCSDFEEEKKGEGSLSSWALWPYGCVG